MSSMQSAPTAIPATKQSALTATLALQASTIRTYSPGRAGGPPARPGPLVGQGLPLDIRFASPKHAEILGRSRPNRIWRVFSGSAPQKLHQLLSSQFRGHLSVAKPQTALLRQWIEARADGSRRRRTRCVEERETLSFLSEPILLSDESGLGSVRRTWRAPGKGIRLADLVWSATIYRHRKG
jgi:hypothetical protein